MEEGEGIPFSLFQSPFSILHSPFPNLHSPFSILHSPFSILHSPFSIFLLTLPAWLPLLLDPGLVNTRAGGDSPFLLQRVYEMGVALRGGYFPVRWMPDAAFGFGYPFWNYYAPLAFYVATGFHLAGLGIVNAIKLTQILGFLGAGAGMYLLADDIFESQPAALLAAVAYTYAPFHLVNVYVRGDSLGEFVAFAFYPLVFLGLRRLRARPGPGMVAFTAMAYAGLILSHNISALIFSPLVITYALWLHISHFTFHVSRSGLSHQRYLLWVAIALTLGLALSAWYWAPALLEQDAVQLEGNLTGYFHYAGHFRSKNLVQPGLLFNFEVDAAGTPFAMGLVQAIFGLVGILVVIATALHHNSRLTIHNSRFTIHDSQFFAGMALVATFLITPWSHPLWDHILLLPFVQFPWRWLSVQAFGLSIAIGGLVGFRISDFGFRISAPQSAIRWGVVIGLGPLIVITSMLHLRVAYLPVRDADVTAERLMLYEMFTGNIGSTVRAEYLPAAANPRPWTSGALTEGETMSPIGAVSARLLSRSPVSQQWQVTVDQPRDLVFPTYWFPGWRATIDGQPAETTAQPDHGGIRVAVPAGTHQVDLALGRTPMRWLTELVSAIGLLLWLLLLARCGLSRHDLCRVGVLVAVVMIAGLVLVATSALARPMDGPLAMDFGQMPYLHPNPDGIRFANGFRLRSYELSATELKAGQVLDIEMIWDWPPTPPPTLGEGNSLPPSPRVGRGGVGRRGPTAFTAHPASALPQVGEGSSVPLSPRVGREGVGGRGPAPELEIALVSPVGVLFHVPAVIAEVRAEIGNKTRLRLTIPADGGAGLYLPRLRILNGEETVPARTLNGEEIGVLYLQPIRIRPTIDVRDRVVGRFADLAALSSVEARQLSPERLEVRMTWWAEQPISANYATSVRLKTAIGETIAQRDTQPCYGFCPTSSWVPGTPVHDRRWLKLPAGTPPGADYHLEIVLYEAASLAPIDTIQINNVALTEIPVRRDAVPLFVFQTGASATLSTGASATLSTGASATLSTGLAVTEFQVERKSAEPGEKVPVRITWSLQKPLNRDLRAHLLLLDETGEQIVHAQPVPILAGMPTSRWPLGAYVTQGYRVVLPRDLLPGQYRIGVGLEGIADWFAPNAILQVMPSSRTLEPPTLPQTLNVDFDDQIRLLGYDLKQDTNALSLLVAWQALTDIDRNYKSFVHLFDPATEQIIAQQDTEPRSGERPTSTWIAGEVITDEFHISTGKPGAGTYRLAIGLYDATTGQRLPAVGPDGGRLPQNRVVLEDEIPIR